MWRLILLLLAVIGGIWCGKPVPSAKKPLEFATLTNLPVAEHKSFVFLLYCHNQALWCEKTLRSIFEQDYDHYRVILIDDASSDKTMEVARQFVLDHNQTEKTVLIRNETKIGKTASLYRAIDNCLDKEIVLVLDGKDWLLSPLVLAELNSVYQNPNIWLTLSASLEYPSYESCPKGLNSYYAALFKQIRLRDLLEEGHFIAHEDAYLSPLLSLASGRICQMEKPLNFRNLAVALKSAPSPLKVAEYEPLANFPFSKEKQPVDLLLFSSDRPLSLYTCLESVQRYMMGLSHCTVIYHASNSESIASYEKLKKAFPTVLFLNDGGDLKEKTEEVLASSSPYLVLGVDEIVMNDFVDLKTCVELMEKTKAYGFYLQRDLESQERPISEELSSGVFVWELEAGESDWAIANTCNMTLFRKETLKSSMPNLKYQTLSQFKSAWQAKSPKEAIGLYFERSKLAEAR